MGCCISNSLLGNVFACYSRIYVVFPGGCQLFDKIGKGGAGRKIGNLNYR